jgi:flavin-dependent dehydrogenase
MRNRDFDVIIVGARCAGAALATFLARAGASVLLVDRAKLPSEHVLSTHTLHPAGVRVLETLGLGDALRARTPELPALRLRMGDRHVDLPFDAGRGEHCPRRETFDARLQDAAVAAGATLHDRTRLQALLWQDGRAVGVRLRRGEHVTSIRAPWVVGADGRASTVARCVQAQEYLAYEAPRGMYWGYFPAPPDLGASASHPVGMYIGHVGEHIRVAFRTDDDCVLLGCLQPRERSPAFQADPIGQLRAALRDDPFTAPLCEPDPVEPVRGLTRCRYFMRRAAGPGWALVGDAGIHKEFVTGDGMTEALIQARNAADALLADSDAATSRFWRQRDVLALPTYFFGKLRGAAGPAPRLDEALFEVIAHDRPVLQRMARSMDRQGSPLEAVPPARVLRAVGRRLARGQLGVLGEFLERGRALSGFRRELALRERLLGMTPQG